MSGSPFASLASTGPEALTGRRPEPSKARMAAKRTGYSSSPSASAKASACCLAARPTQARHSAAAARNSGSCALRDSATISIALGASSGLAATRAFITCTRVDASASSRAAMSASECEAAACPMPSNATAAKRRMLGSWSFSMSARSAVWGSAALPCRESVETAQYRMATSSLRSAAAGSNCFKADDAASRTFSLASDLANFASNSAAGRISAGPRPCNVSAAAARTP
mmetsp:Transcript_13786/g.35004  ORF Transcript_13786/g.35004 Transcript_13786/m.35004 type:complete len:228 (-) Transcript_13786:702-1385(-)